MVAATGGSSGSGWAWIAWRALAGARSLCYFPRWLIRLFQEHCSPKGGASSHVLLSSCCCPVAILAEADSVLQVEKLYAGSKSIVVDSAPSIQHPKQWYIASSLTGLPLLQCPQSWLPHSPSKLFPCSQPQFFPT